MPSTRHSGAEAEPEDYVQGYFGLWQQGIPDLREFVAGHGKLSRSSLVALVRTDQRCRLERDLPGGLNTMISGIGVFYPDKKPTQRVGIVPDVEARPTIAGIRAGRDEVLEEALRQILGRQTPADQIEKMARP